MARPITWQNVNAPSGAAAIEALLRSGRQAGQGFEDIGKVFGDANKQIKEAATGAAVAAIANSADPLAQAAAAPQTWQFDPLAIASAANARKEQLGQEEVRASTLASNELQRRVSQVELQDKEALREGAVLAEDGLKFLEQTGKMPTFEEGDPRASTRAGLYAQEAWRKAYAERQQYELDREQLGIQRAAAARAARLEKEDKAKQGYIAELNALALKPEYFNMEPGARSKLNQQTAQKWGVGHLALEGDAHFANAIKSNLPTLAQLDSTDSQGYNRQDVISGFAAAKRNIEADTNVQLAGFNVAQEVALQSANSEYKGLTEDQMEQLFLKKHPEVTEGWGLNWEAKDVGQRADYIQAEAKRRGIPIERHDAIEMVAATVGDLGFDDKVLNDEVSSMIDRYGSFAKYGSVENLNLAKTRIQETAAAQAAKVDRAINATMRSAVTGEDIDPEVARDFESTPAAQAENLQTQLDVLRAALAEKSKLPASSARDAELQQLSRQIVSVHNRLKKVVPGPTR